MKGASGLPIRFPLTSFGSVLLAALALADVPANAQSPAPAATGRGASPSPCRQASQTALLVPVGGDEKTADLTYTGIVDQSFAFVLPTNPSTGYSWSVSKPPDPAVGMVTGAWIIGTQNPVPGGAGQQVWVFRGTAVGSTSFTLGYSRPWEHGVAGRPYGQRENRGGTACERVPLAASRSPPRP